LARHRPIDRYRIRKPKPFYKRWSFYLLCLLGGFAYFVWLWNRIYIQPHRFDFLIFSINGELKKILDGEEIVFHPMDRIKIINISTNVPFNLYVRLFSKGIDITALRYEALTILSLLPEKEIYKKYRFRIYIKFRNRNLGYVNCIVQPFFEDWLRKLNNTKDLDKRKELIKIGLSLFPEEKKEIIKLKLGLAHAFEEKNLIDKAIREYVELLKHQDQMDEKMLLSIYETLGFLYSETKKYKRAIRYYEIAIDMNDKNPEV